MIYKIPKLFQVSRDVYSISRIASTTGVSHGTAPYVIRLAVWTDGNWQVDYGSEQEMASKPDGATWTGREKVGGGAMSTAMAQLTADRLLTQVIDSSMF